MRLSSDRLSPILVKELRQGIRSQLFTGVFLLIQTLLFFFGLSLVSSESMRREPDVGTAIFWVMLSLPVLLLVPGTASQAVEREVKGKTLELLLLTRLSAFRIVVGKWMSAVVQSALILSTVLPYMMLRYFLGGIDIWMELVGFAVLFFASALLAGIAMGFWSVNVSRWAKVGSVLFLLWLAPWVIALFLSPAGGITGLAGLHPILWIYGVIVMLMMMESAAARIAPPAENHTTRRRVLALVGLGLAFVLSDLNRELATVAALFVVIPTVVVAINEPVRSVARLYEPFYRESGLRSLAIYPLSPGWPGGLAFACVVALVVPFLPGFRDVMTPYLWVALVATFAMPAALMHGLFTWTRGKVGFYLLILVVSSIPIYVYAFAAGLVMTPLATTLRHLGGFFPPLAALLEIQGHEGFEQKVAVRVVLLAVALVSLLTIWRAASREYARVRALVVELDRVTPARSASEPMPLVSGLGGSET